MEIAAPRLILRDFAAEDLLGFLELHSDPRHAEFYGPEETGPDLVRSLFERFLHWAAERPRQNYQLAVVERDSGQLIGTCGVRLEGCPAGTGDFGLQLAPEHWGRGFATESARAMLRFAFDDLGLREVRGETVTENARVQHLVTRLGFTRVETVPGPAWMGSRGWSQTVWRLGAGDLLR